MKVIEIFNYLNTLFPVNKACDFDNVGIIIGDQYSEVKNVLISLDCSLATITYAKNNGCNLIITHHPVIFEPIKTVLAGTTAYELIKNNISVISMHTNLDIAEGGVNDCLCEALGLTEISSQTASDGFLLKYGTTFQTNAESLAKAIKTALNTNVKYVDGGKPINKVLVCSGSGGNYIYDAVVFGFDAVVTSEIKHHQFIFAADNGISVFDAGHYNSEVIVIEPLKELLKEKFSDIGFITFPDETIKQI